MLPQGKLCSTVKYNTNCFLLTRCPPIFDIVLRILTAYLAASRALLSQHLQANPPPKSSITAGVEQEREDLRSALVAAQESAAVQILLEICVPSKEEQVSGAFLSVR